LKRAQRKNQPAHNGDDQGTAVHVNFVKVLSHLWGTRIEFEFRQESAPTIQTGTVRSVRKEAGSRS
jgi:hypothetical protein